MLFNSLEKKKMFGERTYKYITSLSVFFVVVLLLSNIVSTKIITLGPLTFDGGTILFPLSYIFGDILTEVYGFKQARKIIWMGFFSLLLASCCIMLVGWLPAASDWVFQEDYQNILGAAPRIILGSLCAYMVGEFINSYMLAKMKVKTKGKMLPVRTIVSTLIGEGFDTVLFVFIAFYGVFPTEILFSIIVANYIIKVGIEVLLTPLTVFIVKWLKKEEKEDFYDTKTNFSPL